MSRRSDVRNTAEWSRLPKEELLDLRLCDLGLSIESTPLASRVELLYSELKAAGLRFRPHVWISTDWFSPYGVPGFAIPFYLAHPRLRKLEDDQMLEVEGGTKSWCMKLMRHETGHALDTAYRLRRRKAWREQFGAASTPYRRSYVPRPASRRFVVHLDNWYAQSHPLEDFAETFAVWMTPRSSWRRRYADWEALGKLEFVEELMDEIRDQPPVVRSRERTDSVASLRMTLRQYYARKKAVYGEEDRSVYDRDLLRLFSAEASEGPAATAASFLTRRRRELRESVAKWTGQHPYVIDRVLGDMIRRCRRLGLRTTLSERETGEGAAILLTTHAVRLVRRRHVEYQR